MAQFDWIPILQGKYMTYNQIGALVLSAIALLFAFLFLCIYLVLSKIQSHSKYRQASLQKLRSFKGFCFHSIVACLSFIPLIYSALDVIYLFEGIAGMFFIHIVAIYISNGSQIRDMQQLLNQGQSLTTEVSENNQRFDLSKQASKFKQKSFQKLSKSLRLTDYSKRKIKFAILISILLPLFAYKTCISFFNDQISIYYGKCSIQQKYQQF